MNLTLLISNLNHISPLFIMTGVFFLCLVSISILGYVFGYLGLVMYTVLAVVVANIQVTKIVQFSFLEHPIALGTVVFSSIFLNTDLINECFGPKQAKKSIYISFLSYAIFTVFMILTLAYTPVEEHVLQPLNAHKALMVVFSPSLTIFISSMIAYGIGQWNDIWIFQTMRLLTKGKWLLLRTFSSSAISMFFDSMLFSVLAWGLLSEHPIAFSQIFWTYVMGSYILRLCMASVQSPLIYFLKKCVQSHKGIRYV